MIKITDKPLATSSASGDNIFINRNGAIMQVGRNEIFNNTLSAPPIVPSATGNVIPLTDSSDRPLVDLTVYGNTTQSGTPTPEAPIDLVGVENPVVKVMGKNLLENSLVSKTNGVTVTYEHGVFTANGTATASGPQYENRFSLPAGVYTLSVEYVSGSLEKKGDNFIRIGKMGVESKNVEITGKASTQYTHEGGELYVELRVNSGSVYSEYTLKVQLELGDLATEWEDFKSQTLEVPYTLNGVSDVRDYVDFERGVLVRNYLVENVVMTLAGTNANTNVYHGTMSSAMLGGNSGGICSHSNNYLFSTNDVAHFYFDKNSTGVRFYAPIGTEIAKVAFGGQLADPVETPLTAEELEAYKALQTYKPYTTITNSEGAEMSVEYVADTKNYIDQKLASLVTSATTDITEV